MTGHPRIIGYLPRAVETENEAVRARIHQDEDRHARGFGCFTLMFGSAQG